MYKIYKITNIINGKIYVGKTSKTLNERLEKHFQSVCEKRNHAIPIREAILEFGKENFKIELIQEVGTKEDANKLECFFIENMKCCNPNIGYNVATGSDGGNTLSNHKNLDIIRDKLSKSKMGKNNPLAKTVILESDGDILEFGSAEECKRFLESVSIKVASSSIKRKCNGVIKNNKIDKYIVSWKKV
ncbi:MAG: GIY-YIG nuclease family protein [Bacteroidales bacterium]